MRKLIYAVILLLALFTVLRAHTEENESTRFTIHPSLFQISGEDSGLSVGFGFVESRGEKTKSWSIFPIRFSLRSQDKTLTLTMNGLAFLTRSGVHFGGDRVVEGIHRGDVVSVGGRVDVQGTVEGSVWTFGANTHLGPKAVVTGDVVALGGQIEAQKGARILGNKQSIPQLTIPFLGFLTSPQSAETLQFIMELFGILLFLLLLFLLIHFREQSLVRLTELYLARWRGALLYLLLGVLAVPLTALLLIPTGLGVFVLPVFFLLVLFVTYFGFVGASVKLGQLIMKGEAQSAARLYVQGLLGFLLLRIPSLLGRLFALLTSDVFIAIGGFLKVVGAVVLYAALLYSFGAGLVYLRRREAG